MRNKIGLLFVFVESLFCFKTNVAEPFEDNAHKLLSQRAVEASTLDSFTTSQLPEFPRGVNEQLDGRAIIDLISDGTVDEDKPLVRVRHHFHDPTKTWDQAGLTGLLGFPSGTASSIWGQSNQAVGGSYSWHDARSYYLTALTNSAPTYTERKRIYAALFRSIGHLIHLVQDAASPAHTRNDWHISHHKFDPDYFHTWADATDGLGAIAGSGVTRSNPISFSGTQNAFAPIPIARLIDTEKYRNDTTPRATTDIGLAEYSHANFFSDDTVVSSYTNPRINSVDLCVQGNRYYLCKNRDGETGYKIAAVTSYYNYISAGFNEAMVDHEDAVMSDYGALLFPRAIGYSADLIDYFFRGTIKIGAPDRYVYSLAKYEAGNAGFFAKVRFKVSNATEYPNTTEDTVGAGQMWAVVRYRKALSGDLIDNPFGNLSEPFYAVSDPKSASLSRTTAEEHTFDFSGSNRIPTNAADIFLMVVWQGKLGMEDGAVMVGGKNLREPDPFDRGNVSDYDCYQDQIYTVTQPSIQTADRDVNDDNVIDLFGPATETNKYVMVFPSTGPVPSPSQILQNYHFKLDTTTYAKYGRFMMLQEGDTFGVASLTERVEDDFTHAVTFDDLSAYYFAGVWNEINAAGIRVVSPSFLYRGVPIFHAIVRLASLNVLNSPACQSQLRSAPPNMTRLPDTVVTVRE